jgi:hypothetical protein
MFSWSFFLICFGLGLLQLLAAIPWVWALFGRGRPAQETAGRVVRPSEPLYQNPLAIVLAVAALCAAVAPLLISYQARQSIETWGYIYTAVLQVQLTLDVLILLLAVLLKLWPKGGAVAQSAFRESVRQPMFWLIVFFAFLAFTAAPFIPYFTFGEDYIMVKELGYDTIMLATAFFGVLAASLFVTDEIEGRTAITLMSKPVSRRQFLLGKFVGIMLAALLMFGILGFYFQDILLFKHWFDKDDPVPAAGWITATLARWALPGDATDFLRGIGMWTQHMLDTLPGLVLSFCQVMVLVAFAVAFATRVPMVVNLVGVLALYFLSHLGPVLKERARDLAQAHPDASVTSQVLGSNVVSFVVQVLDTILPALEFFRPTSRLLADAPPEPGPYALYLGSVFFYGILYTTIVLFLGLILFEDRDLA